ncbi:MAG: dephospho-CoA kinase [Aerococcus sp.]|nr:dephospho-CoA kinase [Aerococcus sp.]
MTKIIGLTGGIATGKSTVSNMFKAHGIPIIDADQIVYDLEHKGEQGLQAIVDTFGAQYLDSDGELDRRKFGAKVFADSKALEQLNTILRPLIRQRILDAIQDVKATDAILAILDVPLLYEGGYDAICDDVVVVAVDEAQQKARLKARNQLSDEEAIQRIHSQLSLNEKVRRADFVIDNSQSLAHTEQQVEELLKLWE